MKNWHYIVLGYVVLSYLRSNHNWESEKFWLLHPLATQAEHDNSTNQHSASVGLKYDKDGLVLNLL